MIAKAPEPPPPPPPPAPEPPPPPPPAQAPAVEQPAPPPPPEEPAKYHPFFIGGFVGKERLVQSEDDIDFNALCSALIGAKVGYLPRLSESLQAEISVGFKLNLEEGDDSSVFIDAALNGYFSGGFVGGGVSFWDLTEEDTRAVALLVQLGFDLAPEQRWQLVVEGRIPFDRFDDIENNYQFWGGIRFRP